jgi:hypothetical protein
MQVMASAWAARHAQRLPPRVWGGRRSGREIPLNLGPALGWLGHAQLSTPAIYAEAVGAEEQSIAARMWHE